MSLAVLGLTREIATYMKQKMGAVGEVPIPMSWTLDLLVDCNFAITVIQRASRNKVAMSWNAVDLADELSPNCSGRNPTLEEKISRNFPPLGKDSEVVYTPMVITDCDGRQLCWYLPNILTPNRQDTMWRSLFLLEGELAVSRKTVNWRMSVENFREPQINALQPGVLNMAPAWFEQGHDTPSHKLKISAALKKRDSAADKWISLMSESSALLGGIFSIVHPDLYQAGVDAMIALNSNPDLVSDSRRLQSILATWSAPFHAVSIISNRITPPHRDTKSGKQWMDLLVALGKYQRGIFSIPTVGFKLRYNPGTVVCLNARLLRHEADVAGDRACIAYYLREKVHMRLVMKDVGWAV